MIISQIINFLLAFFQKHDLLMIIIKILLIFIITGTLHVLLNKLIKYLPSIFLKYNTKLNQKLIDMFVYIIHAPLIFLIWIISIGFYLEVIFKKPLSSIKTLFLIMITGWISWILLRLLDEGEKYLINSVYIGEQKIYRRYKTTIIASARLLKIFLGIIFSLIIMQTFHIDITGIVALGGASTIVLGIAAKELLANFFGGMMILMDRQFIVGDSIKSSSQGIEGKVEYIGWRLTKIRTLENSLLYVPNSAFLTMSVENSSKRYTRRIKEIIRLKYKDLNKIELVLQEVLKMLKSHPDIDPTQMCFIGIYQFNSLAVDCLLWCFTKVTDLEDYLKVQHDVLYKISNILTQNEIEIASTTFIDLNLDPNNNKSTT